MTDSPRTVVDDLVVSLDYTLKLEDGEVVDSSEGTEPLEFLQGHDQIVPGLEKELYGMSVGDEKEVVVAPADAYGERDDDDVEWMERDAFPPDLDLETGMALHVQDESGQTMVAYIAEIKPDGVLLDFNHPLAGETLFFQVKIAGLRSATPEEIAHGHAHGPNHHH